MKSLDKVWFTAKELEALKLNGLHLMQQTSQGKLKMKSGYLEKLKV